MVTDAERWERERLVEALDAHKRGLSDAPYIRKWFLKSGLSTPLPAGTSESSHDPVGSEMGSAEMTFVVSSARQARRSGARWGVRR